MRGFANRCQTATDMPPIRHHRSDRAGGVTQRAQQSELRAAGVGPSEGTSVDVDERAAGGFAKASALVAVAWPAPDALVDAERTLRDPPSGTAVLTAVGAEHTHTVENPG